VGWQNLRLSPIDAGARPLGIGPSIYDAARDRWLLLGGAAMWENWEWDGAVWTERGTPVPAAPPGGSRLVYDDARGRIYLFGNRNMGTAPWLYEPSEGRWTAQPSTGPSSLPRDWAAVAYDARRDRVMIFGGYALNSAGTSGSAFGDLAEWDPASGAWQSCSGEDVGPGPRTYAALGYDPGRDVLVLFGGQPLGSTSTSTDVWEWYVP
jgi:hypothetical protein